MAGLAKFTLTLAAVNTSGSRRTINVRGTTVVAYSVGSPVLVHTRQNQIGDKSGEQYKLDMRRGEKLFTASEFDMVDVENLGTAAQTVIMYAGYGDFQMPPPNIQVADVHDCAPDVNVGGSAVAIQLIASNPLRKRLFIQNDIGSIASFRICGNSEDLTGSQGLVLGPGDIFEDDVKGEMWALRTSVAAATAHVSETVYNAAPP